MTELFCKMTHAIMAACHWISLKTGEQISFTGDQKVMWVWMLSRFQFFNGSGREWFDNQADIAAATGTSESTVKRFIGLLTRHGYITVKTRRLNGFIQSNSYTILSDLVLATPVGERAPEASTPAPEVVPVVAEERIPDYVPNVFVMPVRPKVNLPSSSAVVPEVVQPQVKMPSGDDEVVWEIAAPKVAEVAAPPTVILPRDIPSGNEPSWVVYGSN